MLGETSQSNFLGILWAKKKKMLLLDQYLVTQKYIKSLEWWRL